MSKIMMWTETDAKGFEAKCQFNEDLRSYEVMVCAKDNSRCRSESFPVQSEPVSGMSEADLNASVRIAENLTVDIEQALGDR